MLLGIYFIYNKSSILGVVFTGLVFLYIVFSLFRLVNKTNRDLAQFLLSIQYDDYESSFTTNRSKSDDDQSLHQVFNLITGKFRDLRSQKEAQHQFLLSLVEQVDTGLICFDENWQTIMMNRALKEILHKSYLPSAKSLEKIDPILYETIINLTIGEKKLLNVLVENDRLQLAILGSQIRMKEEWIRIYVIQNISTELDNQEIKSWQKLIRILTHEIMNSISPVVSLAATTDNMLAHSEDWDASTVATMHRAIQAIKQRGESLLTFTERYRALTRVPPPQKEEVNIKDLLDQITLLFDADLKKNSTRLLTKYPKHKVIVEADPTLLEQVFINLIKNAIEATKGRKNSTIEIQMFKDNRGTVLQFADNGEGIEEAMVDQIFVPFFTTKNEGSGIGLSLSRQIILMHGGTITVQSEPDKGSVFTVRL